MSHNFLYRPRNRHGGGVVVVQRLAIAVRVDLDLDLFRVPVVEDLVAVVAIEGHLCELLQPVLLLLLFLDLTVADRQRVVMSDILILELRHVEVARPAHPPADRIAVLPALVARRTRIGPTLLPLVPRLDEILGLRPKHLRHHALEHPVATVLDPPIDKLLGDRRRQLIVFLRRQQPVLLHALMPAILRNALGTQHVAHVPAQPVQTPPRPRLRPLLQIQIVDVDVVVVDLHDNVLQMLARLSRFLTSNPIRFHDKNGSVWYLDSR